MIHEEVCCLEMVDLVTDWMDDALAGDQRDYLETHLAICPDCVAYVGQLRTTTALAASLDGADTPIADDAKDRLLDAFRAWQARR